MSPIGMDDSQLSVVEKEALGECFASAEARFEYEKARRLRRVGLALGSLVLLVAFGIFMYRLGSSGRAPAGGDKKAAVTLNDPAHKPLDAKPVGSADAKVQVIAIMPEGSDCHSGVMKFLADTATKRPEKIRVEFTTMREYGEKSLKTQIGQVCAAILINGSTSFTVTHDGTSRQVTLVGTEPTHYTVADVGEALTSVFVQQYGDPGEPIYEVPAGTKCSGGGKDGHGGSAGKPSASKTTEIGPIELPGFREMKPKP